VLKGVAFYNEGDGNKLVGNSFVTSKTAPHDH